MQVRPCYAPGRADQTDNLSAGYCVTHRHEWFAEVEISGNQSAAVIDVHNISGEKEIVDQGDDSAICSAHWFPYSPPEINA